MRLKQVKLNGFKSFCDNAEFNFQENGITMVVGPNGCGKSNVVDAVRWALGEQSPKLMRGGSMGDVIFAGSTTRKPVGRAEVTLLFDNLDRTALEKYNEFTEIAVTRRLYRSGESEYLINKLPCRLMDIRELVMDTGAAGRSYSIVEQGRVEEFVTSSPQERRGFMEEAAGITRYKTKRIAAEKKLEQTRQNLLRVEDLLGELNRNEANLRQQMESAREFQALQAESTGLKRTLARMRHDRSAAECTELESRFQALSGDAGTVERALATQQADRESVTLEQTRSETQLRESRTAIREQERAISDDETESKLKRQSLENIAAWRTQLEQTRQDLTLRQGEFAELLKETRAEVAQLAVREEALCQEQVELENRHEERHQTARALSERLANLRDELLECDTQLHGKESQQQFLSERLTEDERRRSGLTGRMKVVEAELADANAALIGFGSRNEESAQALAGAGQEKAALDERLSEAEALLAGQLARKAECERDVVGLRSRLDSLSEIEAGYEGFGQGVRAFLAWADQHPSERDALGVLAPLADLITVPGHLAEWAGDFLAPHLDLIVVKQARALPALARQLETLEVGGVRFVALDALPPPPEVAGDTLAGLLEFAEAAQPLRAVLFGGTRLLPAGSAPHPLPQPLGGGVGWLAGDGAWHIDPQARITLGRAAEPAAGILRRRAEIATLGEQLEQRDGQLDALLDEEKTLAGKIEALQTRRAELDTHINQMTLACMEQDQEIAHCRREGERLEQARELARNESLRFEEELQRHRSQQEELKAEAVRWRETRQRLQEGLAGLRQEEETATELLATASGVLTDKKVEYGALLSRLESLRARLEDMEREEKGNQEKLAQNEAGLESQQDKVRETQQALTRLTAALENHQQVMTGLRTVERERSEAFEQLAHRQRTLDEKITAERRRLDASQERVHKVEMQLIEQRTRLERHAAELAELSPVENPPGDDLPGLTDEKEIERRVNSVQARLQRMGGVNLGAPEEYEALESRIEFLAGQKDDLTRSIDDLEASIRRMNAESRRRFQKTFDAVNEKFQQIFPEVFIGGEARLVLTDSEDPLLAGVDIVAQPPGKKLQNLSLLSGGEKALTAIALIFSFFLYKPSPFCLLDEVDAPLDDINVTRFNRVIQNMTDQSQFIIITHNKRTMEVADRLYGVTMEEAGVSKIVSVNMAAND